MNITKLTIPEAVTLLHTTNVERDIERAASRIQGAEPSTIDLFRYAVWLVDGKPRPVGRQAHYTLEEQKARKRAADAERINAATRAANDLGEIDFSHIDWARRLACKNDQLLFEQTYLPMICGKPNAPYHQLLAERIAQTIANGGRQAILLPRGGAKTTKCRSGAVHGGLFGRIRWGVNIAASESQAVETLEAIKTWLKGSPLLLQDFPEICFPISRIKSKLPGSVAESQTYHGFPTHIVWGREEIRFPSLRLPNDVAEMYREHDPDSVRWVQIDPDKPETGYWIPTAGYTIFTTTGILSGIRGGNVTHPQTLEPIRPNLIILDDVQNDKTASSVVSVSKLDSIITSAVRFLSKPGEPIAIFMPCTVIESNDLADTYGDLERRPDWRGIRIPMVMQWPEGMDDKAITTETETARRWLEYNDIRRQSLREHGDIRDATDYYATHREVMDKGFVVSWEERYEPTELSAIQNAMNLRFENHKAFLSNMQQIGGDLLETDTRRIRWQDFAAKTIETEKGTVPANTQRIVAFVDIQAEYMAYVVLAVSFDLACCFVADYGTFPEFGVQHYRRRQANDWKLLTKGYLASHPHQNPQTKLNADEIFTWGLRELLDNLLARKYTRTDEYNTMLQINVIGLDAQEGIIAPIVRAICRKYPAERVIAYHGFGITAGRMGMENYNRKADTIYEDMRNPAANACRWVWKYSPIGRAYELHSDVNAWKDYLIERLRTPVGDRGSMTLYNAPEHEHELFAVQVCESERPEEYTSRGITRNRWVTVPGTDNEFLDCLTACCALASFSGCVFIPTGGTQAPPTRTPKQRKSFRERLNERKRK